MSHHLKLCVSLINTLSNVLPSHLKGLFLRLVQPCIYGVPTYMSITVGQLYKGQKATNWQTPFIWYGFRKVT